jgi:DNA-3-methyladenine glycosylase
MDDFSFLDGPLLEVAPRLLGCEFRRNVNGKLLKVRIVETEAYDQTDIASHSYRGITPSTEVMFGPSGFLYVYFTYGMHYCCNIVTGPSGSGAAVLIRAAEVISGDKEMSLKRRGLTGVNLTNGPAKLCQALSIDKALNGQNLREEPLKLVVRPSLKQDQIVTSTRIGLSKAQDLPWRFYVKDNSYVSKGDLHI